MDRKTLRPVIIVLHLLLFISVPSFAIDGEVAGEVGYVSGTSVYIDIGWSDGVAEGDTVLVKRGDLPVGIMIVVSTASKASSCRPLFPVTEIKRGDGVLSKSKTIPEAEGEEKPTESVETAPAPRRITELRGRASLGSLLSEDLTSSGLGFSQPAMNMRVTLDNIAGQPLSLNVRHRSRYYGRESFGDRWAHQTYELAVIYGEEGIPCRVEIGRLNPSAPRGLGYIDGALVEYIRGRDFRVGAAGGLRPDIFDASLNGNEQIYGIFADYHKRLSGRARASLAGSLSGSYNNGLVDREFLFLESDYSSGDRFSTANSVEVDLNRNWKSAAGNPTVELTSIFLTTRYRALDGLSMNLSYDTRKRNRGIDDISVPDSLFDDSFRQGLHAGVSWAPLRRIDVSGGFGVRFRTGVDNTISASGSVRVRNFPTASATTTTHVSFFQTMFTRGYRPVLGCRISPTRGLLVDARVGDYIYSVAETTGHNTWIGSSVNYRLRARQYLALSFRGYLSERLRSAQVFAETGIAF